jgi:hypothetical protein
MFPFSRRTLVAFAALASFPAAMAAAPAPALAIRGYDPVAYFLLERATPGDARYTHDWEERRWHFANAHHRDLFRADPVRYAPQFASYCAVAMARGEVVAANPEYWLISDGKLYLFGKSTGAETFRRTLTNQSQRSE